MGRINYWPGKAVQKFSKTTSDYSNNVYLVRCGLNCTMSRSQTTTNNTLHTNAHRQFDRPVVQVIGSFSCPLRRKLEFVVDSIKLGAHSVTPSPIDVLDRTRTDFRILNHTQPLSFASPRKQ